MKMLLAEKLISIFQWRQGTFLEALSKFIPVSGNDIIAEIEAVNYPVGKFQVVTTTR